MSTPKIALWMLAVAGIAIVCGGCGGSDYRSAWAQNRCQRVMAQARMEAVHDLLASGHADHAQRVLDRYLPDPAGRVAPQLMLALEEDGDDEKEAPTQYASVTRKRDRNPEDQTW